VGSSLVVLYGIDTFDDPFMFGIISGYRGSLDSAFGCINIAFDVFRFDVARNPKLGTTAVSLQFGFQVHNALRVRDQLFTVLLHSNSHTLWQTDSIFA
jgi:hypothetical protein